MTPLPARIALDAYFLEARSKLLDLAAILDRLERGANATDLPSDPRWQKLQQGLLALQQPGIDRAEAIQLLFSLPYDPEWPRPTPRELGSPAAS
jgi:hypothetical protein